MAVDPNTIKSHAKTMLSTNLENEVIFQYDSVWGKYFRHLVTAAATALEGEQNAFKEAERVQAEGQASLDRAIFALNIVSSLTLSWLSAAIQYRTDSFITQKIGWTKKVGELPVPPEYYKGGYFIYKLGKDQVATKMFGDSAKLIGDLVTKWGLKNISPEPFQPPDAKRVASSPNLESLRTSLMDEVDKQKNTILANIDKMANAIENDPEYGSRRLAELFKARPTLSKASNAAQELAGYQMINDEINAQRQKWATEEQFYYYGYDPPPTNDRKWAMGMERSMWEAWLAENRKMILGLDMSDRQRAKSWFQSLIQHMFDVNVAGTSSILTSDGNDRDDAIIALLNRVRTGPDPAANPPHVGVARKLVPIQQWVRTP